MKPFNLKEAMVGKGICTRDGTVMKFGAYIPDARKNTRLIVMELSGQLTCRHDDGRFYQEQDSQLDLFMAPNTKSQEVYLYKTGHGIPGCDQAPEFRTSLNPNISCWELVGKSTVTWEE